MALKVESLFDDRRIDDVQPARHHGIQHVCRYFVDLIDIHLNAEVSFRIHRLEHFFKICHRHVGHEKKRYFFRVFH